MPMPYTATEIAAALTASSRRWSFRFERVDGFGTASTLEAASCSVAYNDLADGVQRTCRVQLPDSTTFNMLRDRFRPWARLLMPDGAWQEWAMGTFLLASDTRARAVAAGGGLIELQGWDAVVQTLEDDKVTDRYVVAAGANVLTTVRTILTDHGMSLVAMPADSFTLPAALEWEPGTPYRKIINDLLTAINYRPITATVLGLPTTQAYLDPQSAPLAWSYLLDSRSVVRRGIETKLDLFSVPNRWIAFVSEPDRPTLRSVYTNADLADPLSTVNRQRTIVEVIPSTSTQAVDQTTLDALVKRAAQDARSAYQQAVFSTGLMPFHEGGDVVLLDYGDGPLRYRSHLWELDLFAGGEMRHTMRRVVTL